MLPVHITTLRANLTRSVVCLSALCKNCYHKFCAQFEAIGKSINLFRVAGLCIEVLQFLKTLAVIKRHLLKEIPLFILDFTVDILSFDGSGRAALPRRYAAIIQVSQNIAHYNSSPPTYKSSIPINVSAVIISPSL